MPSPFPGMNPYLEQPGVWKDFHDSFIPFIREMLATQVRPRYSVKINEHIFIHDPLTAEHATLGWSDVSLHRKHPETGESRGTALVAPAWVGLPVIMESETDPYLEIWDRASNEVVTVLELLSPANKEHGSNRSQYLAKVRTLLASRVNFVEIDLLRGGPRMPWPHMPACDYCIVVSRYEDRVLEAPQAGGWPIGIRDRLPEVPVPLSGGEPPAKLDLQAALHRVYDSAGYADYLYTGKPQPPLREPDQEWAQAIISSAL